MQQLKHGILLRKYIEKGMLLLRHRLDLLHATKVWSTLAY